MEEYNDNVFGKLPNHLLVEIFVRLPICEWGQLSTVSKHWATVFRGESFWQTAIARTWPLAGQRKRWPGPIPRGLGKRRYAALYVSEHIISLNGEIDELVGHIYLYLKEQLELSIMPPPSSILHGTIIDQFIACGWSRDKANELASQIWLAVINNLEENEHTFLLLKRLAQEGDSFLPYPYSRPYKVLWRVFEKLFTDFRDCFNHSDYCDILASAKSRLILPFTRQFSVSTRAAVCGGLRFRKVLFCESCRKGSKEDEINSSEKSFHLKSPVNNF